ncbi:hypothetical protein CDD80_613 [Ophiocordyceps camponoti-rufipedis]|uniref:Uncharacterized protein n=1 Tax=Ophiocordyceps camponoti-rufipedis TaxID=2004952 RepID=A0A2C5YJ83_9HYPO|nr:hypothetical protein CDD80_613 [Ophiocordyceps camponoti-rufipedis]
MSKAGKGDGVDAGAVGSQHPVPENIPHLSSPINGAASSVPKHPHVVGVQAGSPVKESSFLHRETSADGAEPTSPASAAAAKDKDGIPIRS